MSIRASESPLEDLYNFAVNQRALIEDAEVHRDQIQAERDAAVQAAQVQAAEPFKQALAEASDQVDALQASAEYQYLRELLELDHAQRSDMYTDTFEILLRQLYPDTGINGFLQYLTSPHNQKKPHWTVVHIEHQLDLLSSIEGLPEDRPTPILVGAYNRYALLDMQAEFEGRPSGTGNYVTVVGGYQGFITPQSLAIEYQTAQNKFGSRYVRTPQALTLQVHDAQQLFDLTNLRQILNQLEPPHLTNFNARSDKPEQKITLISNDNPKTTYGLRAAQPEASADVQSEDMFVLIGQDQIDEFRAFAAEHPEIAPLQECTQ